MQILVQKFGGTSVATLECLKQVQQKVINALNKGFKVVVVLSAKAGKTSALLELANTCSESPDPSELDSLLSIGEHASITLFSLLLNKQGIKARSLLGWQIPIVTNNDFGHARILSIDGETLFSQLTKYDVLIIAGFQGVTKEKQITTLGRGGSDTSAVAIAASLGSCKCEIYTDVEGIYTTDPNLCTKAKKLAYVSYDEMLEMASMGAKVLQIRSVEFAKKYNVPIHVLSTFSNVSGTMVTQEEPIMETLLVSSIAYDNDQACVSLCNIPHHIGTAASIFGPLAEQNILVDMIIQAASRKGLTDITFTVSRKDLSRACDLMEELTKSIGGENVECATNVAKVSLIGVGMRNHAGVAAKAFNALKNENIDVLLISTSEIKISCLIEEKYTELAVRTLHDVFELQNDIASIP